MCGVRNYSVIVRLQFQDGRLSSWYIERQYPDDMFHELYDGEDSVNDASLSSVPRILGDCREVLADSIKHERREYYRG